MMLPLLYAWSIILLLSQSLTLSNAQSFVVHYEPDCSDPGQLDTVGDDFMHFPQYWINKPDECFYIDEQGEPNPMLWATFHYSANPDYTVCQLQYFYPSNQCKIGRFANTLVVTYDISVDAPSITCVPTNMTEEHAEFSRTTLVYVTITEPPDDDDSTGGMPMPEEVTKSRASGLSPIATCFVIGLSIVGALAVAASCYVWRWKQIQNWQRENEQRLLANLPRYAAP